MAAAVLAGCGGGGSSPSLQVVAPDAELRALGETCAGAEPFLYAHATAVYSIADASGKVVARGALPEGKAVAAFNHDPGVDRVPTFCSFSVPADVGAGTFTLRLGDSAPRRFTFKDGRAMVVLN
jgi:hypothetical protein